MLYPSRNDIFQEEVRMAQITKGWYTIYGYGALLEAVTDLRERGYTSSEILVLRAMAYEELGRPIPTRTQYFCPSCHHQYDREWWKTLGCPGCGHHKM